jgi:site-specific recombinase XerD
MYKRDTADYLAWCTTASTDPTDAASLARWRQHLAQNTTHSPNTINRMLSAVRRVMAEAAKQGYTTHETAESFKRVDGVKVAALKDRQRPHNKTRIPAAAMRRMVTAPDTTTLTGLRDRAILHAFAAAGARCAEIASLTIGQVVTVDGGHALSIMGKNATEPRNAPLTREAHAAIMAWIDARPVMSQYVFTACHGRGGRWTAEALSHVSVWRLVQHYAKQAGIEHVKPHDMRRFVLSEVARRHGIHVAQKVAGHKNIATTSGYMVNDLPADVTENLF